MAPDEAAFHQWVRYFWIRDCVGVASEGSTCQHPDTAVIHHFSSLAFLKRSDQEPHPRAECHFWGKRAPRCDQAPTRWMLYVHRENENLCTQLVYKLNAQGKDINRGQTIVVIEAYNLKHPIKSRYWKQSLVPLSSQKGFATSLGTNFHGHAAGQWHFTFASVFSVAGIFSKSPKKDIKTLSGVCKTHWQPSSTGLVVDNRVCLILSEAAQTPAGDEWLQHSKEPG